MYRRDRHSMRTRIMHCVPVNFSVAANSVRIPKAPQASPRVQETSEIVGIAADTVRIR